MAGKSVIFSRTIFLIVTLTSLLGNGVVWGHQQQRTPHMCDAKDDSSEDCESQESGTGDYSVSRNPDRGPLTATNFIVEYSLYNVGKQGRTFTYESFLTERKNILILPNRPWKVLIHGFLNSGSTTFPVNVRDAYLENMQKNSSAKYNVLVVNWGNGACASLHKVTAYNNAAENVESAGQQVGDLLTLLHNEGILDVSEDVHLIGHSLGSHVAGQAARRVFNNLRTLLCRISALDPAGPYFWKKNLLITNRPYPRIQRNRCKFLDVYHTSTMFGGMEEIGDVDFYINGGKHQPSCEIDFFGVNVLPTPTVAKMFLQVCSHNYATVIFAKTIGDNSMRGCTGCYSYSEYKDGKCECEDNPIMGESVVDEKVEGFPIASGTVYITTEKDTSAGSNYLQMLKDNKIFGLLFKGWEALCL